LHFAMLVKADLTRPIAFAIPIALLFAWRLSAHYFQLRRESYQFRNPVGMGAMLSRQGLAGPSPPSSGRESMPPLAPAPVAKPKHWSGQLRVVKVFQETPDVRTFRLVPTAGPRLPFDFLPGQFLNLSFVIDGKKVNRS